MIDRRNTASLKWDVEENELPMWVADMDFATAPCVLEAMKKRLNHGIFGYTVIPEQWYEAYVGWWKKDIILKWKRIGFVFLYRCGACHFFHCQKTDNAGRKSADSDTGVQHLFNSILNNGRQVLESPLVLEDGNYRVDFEDLEQKLADPQTTLFMILCNPHNPGARYGTVRRSQESASCVKKYHVIVVSDEIHCDLTEPECEYVPFASVSEACRDNSVTCIAPTKAFNIAGLQTAAVSVPNPVIPSQSMAGTEYR